MPLKAQDTLVAIKIWSLRCARREMPVREFADSVGISPGEVSKAVRRLINAGLVVERDAVWYVQQAGLCEWLSYGVRYAYAVKPSGFGRGVATSWNCALVESEMVAPSPALIWSQPGGNVEGVVIEPFHSKVPHASSLDDDLYRICALVDAIRLGKPRELKIARRELKQLLEG